MKTYLSLGVGALLIIGVGAFVFMQNNDMPAPTPQAETATLPATTGTETSGTTGTAATAPSATTEQPTAAPSGISSTEVAAHASRESCWSIVNGNVYDLTSWIPKHPGGEGAILGICGKDGSSKFNGQHGKDAKKVALLAGFKIGVAAK